MKSFKKKNNKPDDSDPNAEDATQQAQEVEGSESTEEEPEAVDERTPLEKAEQERDEYLAQWQRAKADYQNLRRRILDDIDSAVQRETQSLMQEMLTVLDYLDMALASPCESTDAKNLQIGVQMTRSQLWQALERQGAKPIPTEGVFNPKLHQAMATVPSDDVEPGTIIEVLRAGFHKQEQVLRHAQVKVAAAIEDISEEASEEASQTDEQGDN